MVKPSRPLDVLVANASKQADSMEFAGEEIGGYAYLTACYYMIGYCFLCIVRVPGFFSKGELMSNWSSMSE